jgi:cardiolipin synthase (CMP-forming)
MRLGWGKAPPFLRELGAASAVMSGFSVFRALPNLITIGRLVLVPAVISVIADERWKLAFILFLIAGVSDAVDGLLAKRCGLTTELGAYLDPIADKVLLASIFVTLAVVKVIPAPLAILVVSRDCLIVGAVILARVLDRRLAIRPLWISKVNTVAQIAFAAAMLGAKSFAVDLGPLFLISVVAVAALTLASAAAYLRQWLGHMAA